MARVLLVSANPRSENDSWWADFPRLQRLASSPTSRHELVEDPQSADIILFSDSPTIGHSEVRDHPLSRAFPGRVFIYSVNPFDALLLPGVYTSLENRWWSSSLCRSGFYVKVIDHEHIQPSPIDASCDVLFSFRGSVDTHPSRERLLAFSAHPRALIQDTSRDEGRGYGKSADVYSRWTSEFAISLRRSRFVLCPRGQSPSSIRVFEVMKAARVPVVISDAWVPPDGPPWDEFSVRVSERDVLELPRVLEGLEPFAPSMGERARQAWDTWFSEKSAFNTIVTWCLGIQEARRRGSGLGNRLLPYLHALRPRYVRHFLLPSGRNALRRMLHRSYGAQNAW